MQSDNSFKIALMGRTNVGKSTLFNRLVRAKNALTYNRPGVTRDAKEKIITIFDKTVTLVDAPGMFDYAECDNKPELMEVINEKLKNIIETSDLIVFVTDGIVGLTANDIKIADILRKSGRNIIMAVNKTEGTVKEQAYVDAVSLGFKNTIAISAEHELGINELLECIYKYIPEQYLLTEETRQKDYIKLAFIGRPNVGKSTLTNALLGSDKQLVADFPGLTRESSAFDFEYNGKTFKLIDTPGVRRKAKISDKLEKISVTSTLRSYRHADVVVLLIDATTIEEGMLEKQDLTLASNVLKDGRALILAFNKYDKTKFKKNSKPKDLIYNIQHSLAQHKDVPFIFISALNNDNLDRLIDLVIQTYERHRIRVSTSKLNRWLQIINSTGIMKSASVKFKLKYITQIGETPPTFLIFVSKLQEMRADKERFIQNNFKQHFNLNDVVVRFIFKSQSSKRKNA